MLSGAGRTSGAIEAGQAITLTLPWRLLDRPDADASISPRILDAQGQMVAQDDRALGGAVDLVRAWRPGMTVTTTHALRLPDSRGATRSRPSSTGLTIRPTISSWMEAATQLAR